MSINDSKFQLARHRLGGFVSIFLIFCLLEFGWIGKVGGIPQIVKQKCVFMKEEFGAWKFGFLGAG